MAQQYQSYSNPTYASSSAPHQIQPVSSPPPSYPHSPESYPAQHHQQSMYPEPSEQKTMGVQQQTMAYQPQQPMSEKPQPPMPGHSHRSPHGSKFGSKWVFSFWDCCSPFTTCLLGTWCPCFLFGRTYDREHGKGETSGCNGMCCAWYCASCFGFTSCLQCIIRGQQREKHGIEGSTFGDFCGALCCPCCGLIQEDKESIVRMTGMNPKTKVAYQPLNQGMQYPA